MQKWLISIFRYVQWGPKVCETSENPSDCLLSKRFNRVVHQCTDSNTRAFLW